MNLSINPVMFNVDHNEHKLNVYSVNHFIM